MNNYQFPEHPLVIDAADFSLHDTMECGQCFSFERFDDGYAVVHAGHSLLARQDGAQLQLYCTQVEYEQVWQRFFALDSDYGVIKTRLREDSILCRAVDCCAGIRVLRQDLWETALQFIISQNNNIKRIHGIVDRLRESFGNQTASGMKGFPSPNELAQTPAEQLEILRCGFRAAYLADAARSFSNGNIQPDFVRTAPLEQADKMLQSIKGVGPKVSACVLLFGAQRYGAFPRDVWINRAMEHFYPQGFPKQLEDLAGVAQQYLFHYARTVYDFDAGAEKQREA